MELQGQVAIVTGGASGLGGAAKATVMLVAVAWARHLIGLVTLNIQFTLFCIFVAFGL